MDNNELKEALLNGRPVIYTDLLLGDIEYRCVSGVIYRTKKGAITVSAELEDKNRHSVTVVRPEQVRYKSEVSDK